MSRLFESSIVGHDRKSFGRVSAIAAWRGTLILTAMFLGATFFAVPATAGPLLFTATKLILPQQMGWIADSADQNLLADLDGDGDLDYTVGNVHTSSQSPQNNLMWYEYVKPTNTWVQHAVATSGIDHVFGGIAAQDVNGDGYKDIVSGPYLLLNPGVSATNIHNASNWGTPHYIMASTRNMVHDGDMTTDFNGDGYKDVLITSANSNGGIEWYQNPGPTAINSNPNGDWSRNVINSRGILPNSPGITAKGMLNPTSHASTEPQAIGDLNGDGRPDVVAANGWYENKPSQAAHNLSWQVQDNQNHWQQVTTTIGAGWQEHQDSAFLGHQGTYDVAVRSWVGDLTGDGKPDIVQAECDTTDTAKIAWIKNNGIVNGNVSFTQHPLDSGTYDYHNLGVADFNRDGRLDIITAAGPLSPNSQGIWVFLDTATSGDPVYVKHNLSEFLSAADASLVTNGYSSDNVHELIADDVDGDGKMDLVFAGWGQNVTPAPFVFLKNVTITPEPSSLVLLGIGAISLVAYGWRRRKQAA